MGDSFGDRMKDYEQAEAGRKATPLLPIMIRLDGKGFSRWTKGLKRPYDEELSKLMVSVTQSLVEHFNACIGYTQSDEISLVLYSDDYKKENYYNGKIQKLVSVSASVATAYFNASSSLVFPNKPLAFFDSRVWTVPNKMEAANTILWREQDATKNSVSMAARHYYSHKKLHGKRRAEMMDMLMDKGVNWNDYPAFFKRGTFVQRKKTSTRFSAGEIEQLPENHEARKNPELEIVRNTIDAIHIPPFGKVKNRVEVIFEGATPEVESQIPLG